MIGLDFYLTPIRRDIIEMKLRLDRLEQMLEELKRLADPSVLEDKGD